MRIRRIGYGILLLVFGSGAALAQGTAGNDALQRFLVEAKKHTYASQGDSASMKPLLSGTRQLEYSQGPFLYRDIYVGESTFAGQEIVYESGKPVWTMSYAGHIRPGIDAREVAAVVKLLHVALMRVPLEEPYRGPRRVEQGAYTYTNRVQGQLDSFHGEEAIARGETKLYELHYGGGLVR
jgi:hypothetical protein